MRAFLALLFITLASAASVQVVFETSMGSFTIALHPQRAPVTVNNFLAYVDAGFYNGLIWHRVIPNFMVQGGGFTPDLQEKPTNAPITNEASNGLLNNRGTVAMARTSDPNSATAQFFVNVIDNNFLNYSPSNPGYAVFGQVIQGMSVVDAIANVPTGTQNGMQNVPITPVVINKAYRATK